MMDETLIDSKSRILSLFCCAFLGFLGCESIYSEVIRSVVRKCSKKIRLIVAIVREVDLEIGGQKRARTYWFHNLHCEWPKMSGICSGSNVRGQSMRQSNVRITNVSITRPFRVYVHTKFDIKHVKTPFFHVNLRCDICGKIRQDHLSILHRDECWIHCIYSSAIKKNLPFKSDISALRRFFSNWF